MCKSIPIITEFCSVTSVCFNRSSVTSVSSDIIHPSKSSAFSAANINDNLSLVPEKVTIAFYNEGQYIQTYMKSIANHN